MQLIAGENLQLLSSVYPLCAKKESGSASFSLSCLASLESLFRKALFMQQ
ncbi:hypothetical protein STRDD11_01860 [Streptococcus sp. DD11]|nr:hypothetical protein STRDD11_01860 [Streptococcus sp. DD11]